MEEDENKNKPNKLLGLLTILIIAVVAFRGYIMNNNESSEDKNFYSEEQTNVVNLEDGNTLNERITKSGKYSKITKELDGIDLLYVTDIEKNGDNCTLKGVIYTQYTISNSEMKNVINEGKMKIDNETYNIKEDESSNEYNLYGANEEYPLYKIKKLNSTEYYLECQAQITDVWKLTNEYRQITVPSNTKCSMDFEYEEKYKTVEDIYDNFEYLAPADTTNPDSEKSFVFHFQAGKCVEVEGVITSL